jgi:hypothetical protein
MGDGWLTWWRACPQHISKGVANTLKPAKKIQKIEKVSRVSCPFNVDRHSFSLRLWPVGHSDCGHKSSSRKAKLMPLHDIWEFRKDTVDASAWRFIMTVSIKQK